MKNSEFTKWFTAHRAAFPGITAQFAALSESVIDGESVSQGDVLKSWKSTLDDLPLDALLDATQRLAKGDPEYPKWLEDHPRLVRQVAKQFGRKEVRKPPGPRQDADRNETFECQDCRDHGQVAIFSTEAMGHMRDGIWPDKETQRVLWARLRKPLLVRCHCKWGDYYKNSYPLVFQGDRMVPISYGCADGSDVERLREAVGTPKARRVWDEWKARQNQEAF